MASVTLQLLRSLEEMLIKGATHNFIVRTRTEVALYVLNQKRAHLRELETRFRIGITVAADPTITGQQPFAIDRGEQVHTVEAAKAIAAQPVMPASVIEEEPEEEDEEEVLEEAVTEGASEAESADGERRGRRRRRRRRGGEDRETAEPARDLAPVPVAADELPGSVESEDEEAEEAEPAEGREQNGDSAAEAERRRRRRGRRGGRRNRRDREGGIGVDESSPPEPELSSPVADFDHAAVAQAVPYHEAAPPDLGDIEAREELPEPPLVHRDEAVAEPVTPAPVAASLPESQPPESEPPRRRSTIREPVPFAIGVGEAPVVPPAAPAPQDIIVVESSEQKPEETDQPRRTGWWARRFGGGEKG